MKSTKALKRELYNRFYRDRESAKFYKSEAWKKTREMKLRRDPLCETCLQAGKVVPATMVHHMIPVKKGTHNLDLDFLVSGCPACHNAIESEMDKQGRSR